MSNTNSLIVVANDDDNGRIIGLLVILQMVKYDVKILAVRYPVQALSSYGGQIAVRGFTPDDKTKLRDLIKRLSGEFVENGTFPNYVIVGNELTDDERNELMKRRHPYEFTSGDRTLPGMSNTNLLICPIK